MQNYPPPQDLVEREIDAYIRENEKTAGTLRFYSRVYQLQRKWTDKMPPVATRKEQPAERQLSEGRPLLADNALVISEALFNETMSAVVSLAENESLPLPAGDLKAICRSMRAVEFFSDPVNLSMDKLFFFLSEYAGADESVLSTLAFLVRTAVKPFYVVYAREAGEKFSFKIWDRGICPVCGQLPMLAVLSAENGARTLECGLCHTRWEFYRRTCPACHNSDHESLSFFYLPEKSHRRVYVCHKCRFYVKTTVLKDLGRPIIPDLENAATMYLDFLAHKEGYSLFGPGDGTH